MSKLADKLSSLSRSSATPLGFHASTSISKGQGMLLIARLAAKQVSQAKAAADARADAGFVSDGIPAADDLKKMVKGAGDVPLGVMLGDGDENKADELISSGCDFLVFGIEAASSMLSKHDVGKFLMIEPSLEQGLVRAVSRLDIDGVFVSSAGSNSPLAVQDLLVYRRLVDLLDKPLVITLTSPVTSADLASLWQLGVDGVVSCSPQPDEALTELRKMIDGLPKGPRGRRSKAQAMIPRHGGGESAGDDEDEDYEDI